MVDRNDFDCGRRSFLSLALKGAALILLNGCASQGSYPVAVAPEDYSRGDPAREGRSNSSFKSRRVPAPPCDDCDIHEVAPMETLPRLAQTYGVSEESICRANHLVPGQPLIPGTKLNIPHQTTYTNVVPVFPNDIWKYIIIHHTAGEVGKALLIDQIHRARGFEEGIGYDFLIDNGTVGKGNGQLEVAPRWLKQEVGAHCKAGGMNQVGIGIGLVGNFDEGQPTTAQMRTLAKLVASLGRYYNVSHGNILGHSQVPGARTDCPGTRFPWDAFHRRLAQVS